METPKSFGTPCGVLNTGMTLIVLLYVALGALGYVYCVSECRDSITLDLPQGPYVLLLFYHFATYLTTIWIWMFSFTETFNVKSAK